jgi:DNA invertase Pin-like site-specific DNA recombinase
MIYGYARVRALRQNAENGRFEIANFAQKCGFSVEKISILTKESCLER